MNPVDVLKSLQKYESRVKTLDQEKEIIAQAIRHAITETIQRIASVIINERRQEIEDACNFSELRDALAAELARQFMASRMLGQPTPLDKPNVYAGQPRVGQGGLQSASNQALYASQMVTAFGNAKGKP